MYKNQNWSLPPVHFFIFIMSYINYEINNFFDYLMCLRWNIEDYEKWINSYKDVRKNYPDWKTQKGEYIKIENLSDEHLTNLIKFIKRKDPNNKTKWIEIFEQEKEYRKKIKEFLKMKEELINAEYVSEVCF